MSDIEVSLCIQAMAYGAVDIFNLLKNPLKDKTNSVNASGDIVSTMDVMANKLFIDNLAIEDWCAGVASEELDNPIIFDKYRKYVVTLDPLDGSSNIDVDGQVGTIFGMYKIQEEIASEKDFLQPAKNLVAAGYILYGPKLTMVVAHNNSVQQIIINHNDYSVEVICENKTITCPLDGKIISANYGNYPKWDQLTCDWFDSLIEKGKSSFRYSGCMVVDFHRVLLQGGIFAYPADNKNINGKLRLLFECAPLAYIMHMAGGSSTAGHNTTSIIDIIPSSLHQTIPVFIGSKNILISI